MIDPETMRMLMPKSLAQMNGAPLTDRPTPPAANDAQAVKAERADSPPLPAAPQTFEEAMQQLSPKSMAALSQIQPREDQPPRSEDAGDDDANADGDYAPASLDHLRLPDGVEADHPLTQEATSTFAELGLAPGAAQRLLDCHEKAVAAREQLVLDDYAARVQDWRREAERTIAREDIRLAAAAVQEHGSKELVEVLSMTGAGNHPAVIRFIASLAEKASRGW